MSEQVLIGVGSYPCFFSPRSSTCICYSHHLSLLLLPTISTGTSPIGILTEYKPSYSSNVQPEAPIRTYCLSHKINMVMSTFFISALKPTSISSCFLQNHWCNNQKRDISLGGAVLGSLKANTLTMHCNPGHTINANILVQSSN